MQLSDDALYKILLGNQFVDEKALLSAKELAATKKTSLYEALIRSDAINDENIGKVMADALHLPFIVLAKTPIEREILQLIPQVTAQKQHFIAFGRDVNGIKVATSHPENQEFIDFLVKKTGERINLYFATDRDIAETTRLYKKELQNTFDALLKEQVERAGKSGTQTAPIAKIVDLLIEYAYDNKASDIHIEPDEQNVLVRFRIDGVLHDVLHLPKALHDQIITRIKVLSRLRTDEHLSAQDGKMQLKLQEEMLDLRVSIVPIVDGEKAVMRLLSSHSRQFSLQNLGMGEKDLNAVRNGFSKPYGMVLATGPTGSGKTTTIYAIVKIVNTRDKNIATIEDPVEYDIAGINQIQVNPKTNLTFAAGLRAILRQDPDIIFVGEIRDEETANIAINSAMTGHLVVSTLHTNNAATTLPRLIDMNIEPFLVASTVNTIIGQRLVRVICEKCRYSTTMQPQTLEKHIPQATVEKHFGKNPEVRVYKGKGCGVCHGTGFAGRVGVYEVLEVTPAIQELISAKAEANLIHDKAVQEGMTTMLDDGLDKVLQGITTVEEVLRATKG